MANAFYSKNRITFILILFYKNIYYKKGRFGQVYLGLGQNLFLTRRKKCL